MPWRPLPKIAFAIATYPFEPSSTEDLPLELGDELYIIEEGGKDWSWCRGYLVAPPSIIAGLTSVKGRTLEARVFSGIFPRACVTVREYLENTNRDSKVVEDQASTVRRDGSSTPRGSENGAEDDRIEDVDDEGSICPEDSASQISISEDSRNGHIRVRKKRKETPMELAPEHLSSTTITTKENRPTHELSNEIPASDALNGKPAAPVPMLKIGDNSPSSQTEPLVDEIASCLREWYSTNLHELILSRRYDEVERLAVLQKKLNNARRQMQSDSLTKQELHKVRETTVWNLVEGNKMLSNEVIVRDPRQSGRLLTSDDNALEVASLQAQMSLLEKPVRQATETVDLNHVLFELKDINASIKEQTRIYVSLYIKEDTKKLRPLTEPYLIQLPAEMVSKPKWSQYRALFSDLSASDIGETQTFGTKVYLVIKAQSRFILPRPSSRHSSIKEPSSYHALSQEDPAPALKSRRSLMFGSKGFTGARNKPKTPTQPSVNESIDTSSNTTDKLTRGSSHGEKHDQVDLQISAASHKDIGYAIFELPELSGMSQGMDKTIDLWSPATRNETEEHRHMHVELLDELFASYGGSYARSPSLNQIRFRIQSFQHLDALDLIRETPTILHDAVCSPKIGFSGVPEKQRSDIYLTVSDAHLAINGMLSHPTRGAVPMTGVSEIKNLVLTVEVKLEDGRSITDCISDASNAEPSTSWQSSVVSRGCKWSQTLKLSIPRDQVIDSHVVLKVSDGTEHPFGLCYLPLWTDGAFISDGSHDLLCYQNDNVIDRIMGDRLAYLHLGWSSKPKNNRQSWSYDMAVLRIRTDLVSTIFSQNQVLLSVLNWKDQSDEDLTKALQQIRNVPDLELVKFISDVFDALFGILVQRSGNDEFEDLIFRSIVEVLTIAQSKRYDLAPVVDDYTHQKFSFPFAAPCLMRSYLRLIARRDEDNNSRHFRATLKVSRQMLKFILQARRQQIQKEEYIGINNSNDEVFLREIKKLFSALEEQMRDSTPSSVGNKTLLVQSVHTWLPDLSSSFGEHETAALAVAFTEACSHVFGKLVMHRLVFIWNLVKLSLKWDISVRNQVKAEVISWISQYWGETLEVDEQYREQVRLCVSICALWNGEYGTDSLDLYVKTIQSFQNVVQMPRGKSGTFSLLFPSSYPFPIKPTDVHRGYDECLIELSALKATFPADTPFTPAEHLQSQVGIVTKALAVDVMILQGRAFPKSWITYHAFYHRVAMDLLRAFTELATASNFIPAPEDSDMFNMDLWRAFLDTLLVVVRSDALALEALPEQRRKAVWRIVGDLREKGAQLLSQNWHALGWPADQEDEQKYGLTRLGGYQVQYVPSLVGPIVELCLGVHEGLRRAAVEVLRSMIISEHDLNGDIVVIQVEMVRTLNELFKSKTMADTALQRLFIDQLMAGFQNLRDSEENGIWTVCHNLVLAIDELLDLLVAAHAPDQHATLALMNSLALLDFLRGMEKDDLFIEYAHQLAGIQAKERNYQEAGLALRLHADLYAWDLDTQVEELENPRMPAQTMFDRKEEIYMRMIEQYEKGLAWGAAMDCYLELAHQYQHTTFNFSKLAKAQHSMARVHEAIAKGEGESSRYFHVEFAGLGFPENLRNKAFIYEGIGTERLTTFNDRLQEQYPVAKLLDANEQADVEESEGQYIKIAVVQVHNDLDQPILRRAKIPLSIKEYVLFSKPKLFSMVVSKYSTGAHEPLAANKLVFSTIEAFPTILRRSQINSQSVVHLTAIETAVERVLRKTFELRYLSKRVTENVPGSLKTLAEAIKSQVDPVSKSSVAAYRPLIHERQLKPQDPEETSSRMALVLETALVDFVALLRDSVSLLQDTKHHIEYQTNTALLKLTFEPELIAMAPLVTQPNDDHEELRSEIYSMEISTASAQSLPNGMSDSHAINGQIGLQRASEARGRLSAFFKRNTERDSSRQPPRATSSNGTASAPENLGAQHGVLKQINGNKAGSNPTLPSDRKSYPSTSSSKAAHRQSWRTTSDDTNGALTGENTPKGSLVHVDDKKSHTTASRERTPSRPADRSKITPSVSESPNPNMKSTAGSIRKRLSVFGMGKKNSKLLVTPEGVQEEDV